MSSEENETNKKEQTVTEYSENIIDNTLPARKLWGQFRKKNRMAYHFLINAVKRRGLHTFKRSVHYALTGHTLNRFGDKQDGQIPSGYFETFNYRSFAPKFITSPNNTICKEDPVTELLRIKHDWIREINVAKGTDERFDMLRNIVIHSEDVIQCSPFVVRMAKHLDSDPDPNFNSTYNWYYAGNGNFHLICIDWLDYLLHCEFNTLYISRFNKESLIKYEPCATYDCGEGNNIFEAICSSLNIIALRTKHKITILKINSSDGNIVIEKLKEIESEMIFTGIAFDKHHKNILYMTKLNQEMTIVNLDRMTGRSRKLKTNNQQLLNNWNTVVASQRLLYAHVYKDGIIFYDKRNDRTSGARFEYPSKASDSLSCNQISAVTYPEDSNGIFFTTEHHLFLLDVRAISREPVHRWTHGAECTPTYLSMCNFEYNKDLVCISSQWCKDMCVVGSHRVGGIGEGAPGVFMPYRPPSIFNALTTARQEAMCSDIYNSIDMRLASAVTGNIIYEDGEGYKVLTLNSFGDILSYNLFPLHMQGLLEDDAPLRLHEWSKFYKFQESPFEVTQVVNIADIWRKLKQVPEDYKINTSISQIPLPEVDDETLYEPYLSGELDVGLLEAWVDEHELAAFENL